jgi:hypothetical protein
LNQGFQDLFSGLAQDPGVGGSELTYSWRNVNGRLERIVPVIVSAVVGTFLVWCVVLVLCWPLALLAVIVYPIVWILLIPFRIVGIAVDGVLGVIRGIVMLPARVLGGHRAA